MSEYQNDNILENEIAELNREIEAKRALLEAKKGISSERGVLHEVVAEKLDRAGVDVAVLRQELKAPATPNYGGASAAKTGYLNSLSDDQAEAVNRLVNFIPSKGIAYAITEAKKLDPFLLDAFHDALVDKLYDELVGRGLLNK